MNDIFHLDIQPGENNRRGETVLSQIDKAALGGKTHILVLEEGENHDPVDLRLMESSVEKNPDAVILGRLRVDAAEETARGMLWRRLSNFWIRLQTRRVLKDSTSTLRAYPLDVLRNLKLRCRGPAFDVEVLVKALWADVEVKETELRGYRSGPSLGKNAWERFKTAIWITMLNVHYTFRSITPIPHVKIGVSGKNNRKISVLRPLTSLRRLLTENLTPGEVAAAGALGVLLGTLPLIGCHTVAILFASNFLRLNKVAAVAASQLCMPPIVPALCVEAGHYIRHGRFLTEMSMETLGHQALDRLFEWFVGSLVMGPVFAAAAGCAIYAAAICISRARAT